MLLRIRTIRINQFNQSLQTFESMTLVVNKIKKNQADFNIYSYYYNKI